MTGDMIDVVELRPRVHVAEALRHALETLMIVTPATGQRHLLEAFLADLVHALEHVTLLEPADAVAAALEYYADPASYKRLSPEDTIPAGLWVGDARVLIDSGAQARRALQLIGAVK